MLRILIKSLAKFIWFLALSWPMLSVAEQDILLSGPANHLEPTMAHSTLLHDTNGYAVNRLNRHLIVTLKQPHRVLSTSDINGGEQTSIRHILNFQSMEANNHQRRFKEVVSLSPQEYHQRLARTLQLPDNTLVSMGTAANINNASHVQKSFRDLTVDAFVTAGVRANALRSGDPAKWYQGVDGNELVDEADVSSSANSEQPHKDAGTINIIVVLNRSITSGALTKAVAVITEAKSAALNTLAVPSTQSQHLATGTGTDQFALAAPLESSLPILNSASGHLKLGELLGAAVFEAVMQAVELQDSLSAHATRSVIHALKRHGASEQWLLNELKSKLNEELFSLLSDNSETVFNDAKLVAAAYAYAALLDRLEYGTLSESIRKDVLLDQAVNAALAISDNSRHWAEIRARLKIKSDNPLDLFVQAVSIGWSAKWES